MEFNWNIKRNVQVLTPNKQIVVKEMSPKEVIAVKGNRVGQENILDSLLIVVNELIQLEEARSERINQLYAGVKNESESRTESGSPA